jgi:hypothetical protein
LADAGELFSPRPEDIYEQAVVKARTGCGSGFCSKHLFGIVSTARAMRLIPKPASFTGTASVGAMSSAEVRVIQSRS